MNIIISHILCLQQTFFFEIMWWTLVQTEFGLLPITNLYAFHAITNTVEKFHWAQIFFIAKGNFTSSSLSYLVLFLAN